MSLNSKFATWARKATSRVPPLYRMLRRLHHRRIEKQESKFLSTHFPDCRQFCFTAEALSAQHQQGFRSQFGQDWVLSHLQLIPERDGRFIEIGCNHPEHESNSWYLDVNYGYSGLAIDPLIQFADLWQQQRRGTRFVNAFVSSQQAPLSFAETSGSEGWESMLSGAAESVNVEGKNIAVNIRHVQPRTLDDILTEHDWTFDVDVLFVDVEGHEREVLESAPWDGPVPAVLVAENTGSTEQQMELRNFIMSKGYELTARVSIYDDIYVHTGHRKQ